jgi:hypothetical protein
MDAISEMFSGVSQEYVVTLCLCRATPYETVYVYDWGSDLEDLKRVARRLTGTYGRLAVRLRRLTFDDPEARLAFIEQAEWDREKLEDYTSDHGVDESGGYF